MRDLLNIIEAKNKMPKAGTIPYYFDNGILYVCLFVSNDPRYGGPDPSVPKGGVDDNETIVAGAIRETHEETGIPINDLQDIMLLKNTIVTGLSDSYDMYVFASKVPNMSKLYPQVEGTGVWLSITDAMKQIRNTHKQFLTTLVSKLNYKI